MYLDIAVALTVLCLTLWGFKAGFSRAVVGLLSAVISIAIGALLYQPLCGAVYKTDLPKKAEKAILSSMGEGAVELDWPALPNFARETVQGAASAAAEKTREAAAAGLAKIAISILCFLAVIAAAKFGVRILCSAIDLVARLPVLRQLNMLLGGAFGFAGGVVLSYVFLAVLAFLSAVGRGRELLSQLDSSTVASTMYHNNLLLKILGM